MVIKISTLSCLNYSCSDEGLTLETSAPETTYGDDHKHFNLELSKLHGYSDEELTLDTSTPYTTYIDGGPYLSTIMNDLLNICACMHVYYKL